MNSPRKPNSAQSSPRGVSLPPVQSRNSPKIGGGNQDSPQVTPRIRQKAEMDVGRDHPQVRLPTRMTGSSRNLADNKPLTPKAPPRSYIEEIIDEEEKEQHPMKTVDSFNLPTGGRYGNRGGGDALLRLPLEGLSKLDLRDELKHGKKPLAYGYQLDNEDGEEDADEDESEDGADTLEQDHARFNVWKGKNYELHVLGDYKSDFEKRIKTFQRPTTEPIVMDPFCRNETGLQEEPPKSDAFLVWKSKPHLKWNEIDLKEPLLSSPFPSLSSGESGEEIDFDEYDDDGDSLPDPEMNEYIQAQQQKREEGESVTGETLYYDGDFETVRNLHRDSHSLTSYGVMPDHKWIGKAHLFYPEMTEDEKKMLRVPEDKMKSVPPSPRYSVGRRIHN